MKTAICVDSLIERDDSTFLLELVLNLMPNSELYTIAHKQGSILGPIETRPIVSSYLSHKTKNGDPLKRHFWILPSAIKGIPFHSSIEKVLILSRGYVHGLRLPSRVEAFLYLLDWDLIDQSQLGWQKVFTAYVNQWRENQFSQFKKIAVSSQSIQKRMELPNAEVIPPSFKTADYTFVKDEDHDFNFEHHLVFTHGLEHQQLDLLLKSLFAKEQTVRLIGPDHHLKALKDKYPQADFVGDHCAATTSLYSHKAKVVWDLSQNYFPSKAMGALCNGRPVVVWDRPIQREFLSEGTYFFNQFTEDSINHLLVEIEQSFLHFDRRLLRRTGLKLNERLFKSRMAHFLGLRL
jgi:hypothetical protein